MDYSQPKAMLQNMRLPADPRFWSALVGTTICAFLERAADLVSFYIPVSSFYVCSDQIPTFHPEYGRFMLESTPGSPYGASLKDLLGVEGNMRLR